MSASRIIQTLEKLLLLYKSLYSIAVKKTEVIKKGTLQPLNTVISEEKQHLQAIQKLERNLMQEAKIFLDKKGIVTGEITISKCIEQTSNNEKTTLENQQKALEAEVNKLKKQNELNQQLLEQSLQFVNLSLDMLSPEIDAFNYDHPDQEQEIARNNRSIFDSKA